MHVIKRKIQHRHGAVTNIRLWREHVSPETALVGDLKTLEECGLEGSFLPEPSEQAQQLPETSATDAEGEDGGGGEGEGEGKSCRGTRVSVRVRHLRSDPQERGRRLKGRASQVPARR